MTRCQKRARKDEHEPSGSEKTRGPLQRTFCREKAVQRKLPRSSSVCACQCLCARVEMLEEPFVDAHVPRARFAPARPLRTSILWCVAIGLALMVMSMSFALVFDRGFYFYSQSTAMMLAEAASAVPEVRARWAALHLQLSTLAMDAWEDVAGGAEKGESGGVIASEEDANDAAGTRRRVSRRALRFVRAERRVREENRGYR